MKNNQDYQSPVSLPPVTVSCKDPLLEIILTREAPLIFPLARMWVPALNTSTFDQEWHSPVCNVGMRCLHSVFDLLIELLDLLPHHLKIESGLLKVGLLAPGSSP